MRERTLMLWKWIHENPKILEPFLLDEFLGLGTHVTPRGEAQVLVNGLPVYAEVYLPNSEVSRELFLREYEGK